MSGIFGCWDRDAGPANGPELRHGLSPHPQRVGPLPSTLDQIVCLFDGRLDNRDGLRSALKDHRSVGPRCPDRDLVAAAYDRFGEAFIERVEGDFAVGLFDRRRNLLLLARDRLGLRPLCYTEVGSTLLFASDVKALLAHPGIHAAPDETTLADFILYFLAADAQTRTFFRNIHSLPPAHLLVASAEGIALRRYFDFNTTQRIRFDDVRDYAHALDERVGASVRNRIRSENPVAIAVSGGLDSSYLFCTAQRLLSEDPTLCPAILGFHNGGPPGTPSDESRFVDEIERQSGARIARLSEQLGFLECASDEVWHSESPRVDLLSRQGQAVRNAMYRAGARRLLTGHWGDQLFSDSDYLLDLLRRGRWTRLKQHASRWQVGARGLAARLSRDVFLRRVPSSLKSAVRVARHHDGAWQSPWFTPRFRRLLRERFTAERLARRPGTSHAWAIYQQARLGYHVQCMEWNVRIGTMHGLDLAFPYLDCDLIQFLMSIPGEMQSVDGIQRGLMREAMRGTVPDAIVDRRSKGEFTHLGRQSIEREFPAIRELLGPTALSVQLGYVDGPALWKVLDEWRPAIAAAENSVLATRLTDLCGMELFLRRFFARQDVETTAGVLASC